LPEKSNLRRGQIAITSILDKEDDRMSTKNGSAIPLGGGMFSRRGRAIENAEKRSIRREWMSEKRLSSGGLFD